MLIPYPDINNNTKPMVIVYRGTNVEVYLNLNNAPTLYYNVFRNKGTRYIGFSVWTDNQYNPPSNYLFGPIWINMNPCDVK